MRKPVLVSGERSSRAGPWIAALAILLLLIPAAARLLLRRPPSLAPVAVTLPYASAAGARRSPKNRPDGTALVEVGDAVLPDEGPLRAPRPPEVGRIAGGEASATKEGVGARIAAALRAAGEPTPAPRDAEEPPAQRRLKAAAAEAGASGTSSSYAAPAKASEPAVAASGAVKRTAAPPTVAPPSYNLSRWLAGVKKYLEPPKPPADSPRRPRPAASSVTGGGDAVSLIEGKGAPSSTGQPSLEPIPEAKGPDGAASLKPGGRGGLRGVLGAPSGGAGPCGPGQVARDAPTRGDPARVLCDTRPSTHGTPDRAAIAAVREKIARILTVLRDSALHPGIGALKQVAAWSAADIQKARVPIGALKAEHAQALAYFEGQTPPEARRAAGLLRELGDWLAEGDGPVEGLASVEDRLTAAKRCLEGTELHALADCHASAVIPGLGRGLHSQAEEVDYLARALRQDPDLSQVAFDLQSLAAEDASLKPLFDRFVAFVNSAQRHADAAARSTRNAASAWDTLKDGATLGRRLADAAGAQKQAFDGALEDLSRSGAYAAPAGMGAWSQAMSTRTSMADSEAGWRQSYATRRADASAAPPRGSAAKPVERIEGAVDGSQGAVSAMVSGAKLLQGLEAILAGLK